MKEIFNLTAESPQYLIVPFEQIKQMLTQGQIAKFQIDPLLQIWLGSPNSINRIITMIDRNGMTYLVKARYDPQANQIFPPV